MYNLSLTLALLAGSFLSVSAEFLPFNFNPAAPGHIKAHIFMFGNGSVPIAEGPNPFANNALDGSEFLTLHMGLQEEDVSMRRQEALDFWYERFGIQGDELIANNQGVVIPYQISPEVNERAYVMNTPCRTPPEGHEVIDGGFQLFVTDPNGVEVPDPLTGEAKTYPFQTNLVYSWLRIHLRDAEENCGLEFPPPEWVILRYQTLEPAKWTLNAIVFELEVIGENYFGTGRSLGISAPIVSETTITNRLLNYMTFETEGLETELRELNMLQTTALPQELTEGFENGSEVDYITTESIPDKPADSEDHKIIEDKVAGDKEGKSDKTAKSGKEEKSAVV